VLVLKYVVLGTKRELPTKQLAESSEARMILGIYRHIIRDAHRGYAGHFAHLLSLTAVSCPVPRRPFPQPDNRGLSPP
jgi:hypothetical protein